MLPMLGYYPVYRKLDVDIGMMLGRIFSTGVCILVHFCCSVTQGSCGCVRSLTLCGVRLVRSPGSSPMRFRKLMDVPKCLHFGFRKSNYKFGNHGSKRSVCRLLRLLYKYGQHVFGSVRALERDSLR